ncbi:MAG TPA: hypothetical protein VJT09_15760 [Pyrinomonadaceae bacterium]|nr:hypothetical protein [Pyrinomonadaceae bacterium]
MTPLTLSLAMCLLVFGTDARPRATLSQLPAVPETARTALKLSASNQRITYLTYQNARYGYTVEYPAGILVPQGEADNGDGQKFLSRDGRAELLAYGSNRLDRTLQDEYRSAQENREVTYKLIRRDMFVVSGRAGGKIFYQKTLLRGDVFKTFIIEYDESERARFDQITTRIARTFAG